MCVGPSFRFWPKLAKSCPTSANIGRPGPDFGHIGHCSPGATNVPNWPNVGQCWLANVGQHWPQSGDKEVAEFGGRNSALGAAARQLLDNIGGSPGSLCVNFRDARRATCSATFGSLTIIHAILGLAGAVGITTRSARERCARAAPSISYAIRQITLKAVDMVCPNAGGSRQTPGTGRGEACRGEGPSRWPKDPRRRIWAPSARVGRGRPWVIEIRPRWLKSDRPRSQVGRVRATVAGSGPR